VESSNKTSNESVLSDGLLTVGSLFSGIGGFDEGFRRAGLRTLWVCEQDPFCQFVLRRHFPEATLYPDVSRLHSPPRPTVMAGGFPCQDVSTAKYSSGKGVDGLDGKRSGLWSEFFRLVRALRPEYVVIENSPNLTAKGLDRILCDLAEGGYDAEWDCVRAHDFGAPHLRERLYLVAYPNQERQERQGRADRLFAPSKWAKRKSKIGSNNWWTEQPEPQRVADGFPGKLDKDFHYRVAATGNSLVPQIAEYIGEWIIEDYSTKRGVTPHGTRDPSLRGKVQGNL
jgi:DNA (cytosine-5)-methyltransferase 1